MVNGMLECGEEHLNGSPLLDVEMKAGWLDLFPQSLPVGLLDPLLSTPPNTDLELLLLYETTWLTTSAP